jgi:hypothetical protein
MVSPAAVNLASLAPWGKVPRSLTVNFWVASSGVRAKSLEWLSVAMRRYPPFGEMAAVEIFSSS